MDCVVCKEKTWGIEALQCTVCQRWTHNDHSQTALHRFYQVKYGSSSSYNCRDCTSQLMSEKDANSSLENNSSLETTSSNPMSPEISSSETTSSTIESSIVNINNTPFVILHQGRKSRMIDSISQQSLKDTKEKYSNLNEDEFIKSNNTDHLKPIEMDQNKDLLSNIKNQILYPNHFNPLSKGNEILYNQNKESNKLPNSKIDYGILNATHIRRKQRRSPPYLPSWSDTPKVIAKSKARNRTLFSDSIFDRAIKQKIKMPPVAIEYVNLEETNDNIENQIKSSYSNEINDPIDSGHNESNTHISCNLMENNIDKKNKDISSISLKNNYEKITKKPLSKNNFNLSSVDISTSLGIPGPVYIEEYVPPFSSRSPQKNKNVLNVSPEVDGLYQLMNALGVENGLSKIINSLEVDKVYSEIDSKISNNDISNNNSHDNIESRIECSRSFNPEEHLSQLKEMDSCFGNTFLLNKCKKYCKEYLTILNDFPYRPLWDPAKGSAAANAMWLQHGDIPLHKCIDLPVEPTPTVRSAMKITFENQINHDDYVEQKINILSHLYTRRLQYNRKLKQENEAWVRKGQVEFIPNYQEMQMAANIAFFTLHNLCKIKLEIAKIAEMVFREKDQATYSYVIYRSKAKAFMKKVNKDIN